MNASTIYSFFCSILVISQFIEFVSINFYFIIWIVFNIIAVLISKIGWGLSYGGYIMDFVWFYVIIFSYIFKSILECNMSFFHLSFFYFLDISQ